MFKVHIGLPPWTPTPTAKLALKDIWEHDDIPVVGVFEDRLRRVFFYSFEQANVDSGWIYCDITGNEAGFEAEITGINSPQFMVDIMMKYSVDGKLVVANAKDGVIVEMEDTSDLFS